jgi:hypothetical protein
MNTHMLKNLHLLTLMIDEALTGTVPGWLLNRCGEFYSPYYEFMRRLALSYSPCLCVELGVETGRCSAAMAYARDEVIVVGIDSQPTEQARNLALLRYNFLYVIQSSTPPPAFLLSKRISILHIDTAHSYDQVKVEWAAYKPLMESGGVVCWDDTHAMNDGVMQFVKELPYPTIFDDRLHPICGYAVMLYDPS